MSGRAGENRSGVFLADAVEVVEHVRHGGRGVGSLVALATIIGTGVNGGLSVFGVSLCVHDGSP